MTQPREHCGELPPGIGLNEAIPPGECVLRPGHSGSHASENGMRWWLAAPAPTVLRDLYAAAIASYDHAVGQATDPAPRGHHYGQADAVLAVRDQELEGLRAEVAKLRAAILDIDAHATPIGLADPADPDGNPHHYAVTVGSLHRALGKIGHTAAPCTAEATLERVRQLAERWENALAPDLAYARALRAALDPKEQP